MGVKNRKLKGNDNEPVKRLGMVFKGKSLEIIERVAEDENRSLSNAIETIILRSDETN